MKIYLRSILVTLKAQLARLTKVPYIERLQTFRNKDILPDAFVEQGAHDITFHVLDPETRIIPGTFGEYQQSRGVGPKLEGYHLYNDRTKFNAFFEGSTMRYHTGMKANQKQQTDIKENHNFL